MFSSFGYSADGKSVCDHACSGSAVVPSANSIDQLFQVKATGPPSVLDFRQAFTMMVAIRSPEGSSSAFAPARRAE